MQTTHLQSAIRLRTTAASPHYVGSITLSKALCLSANLSNRQLVQIRLESTSFQLWTYVIQAPPASPDKIVCLNGGAALHIVANQIISLSSYITTTSLPPPPTILDLVNNPLPSPSPHPIPQQTFAQFVCSKVHRPRVTAVSPPDHNNPLPCIKLDAQWLRETAIPDGIQAHLVNVTNGQRDVLVVRAAPSGSRQCEVCLCEQPTPSTSGAFGARSGYAQGDVVILMTYGVLNLADVRKDGLPPMLVCFPEEVPQNDSGHCMRKLQPD